jgi:hypothetical protein
LLMLPWSMNPLVKLSFDTLRLGCETYSLIGFTQAGAPRPSAGFAASRCCK